MQDELDDLGSGSWRLRASRKYQDHPSLRDIQRNVRLRSHPKSKRVVFYSLCSIVIALSEVASSLQGAWCSAYGASVPQNTFLQYWPVRRSEVGLPFWECPRRLYRSYCVIWTIGSNETGCKLKSGRRARTGTGWRIWSVDRPARTGPFMKHRG